MSLFGDVVRNIIIAGRNGDDLYNRIFVVSAYGGITDLLLENKKNGKPGVYAKFANNDPGWRKSLEAVREAMLEINRGFAGIGLDVDAADAFVDERIEGLATCLSDLIRLRSFGHFRPDDYLPATREFLSAAGEAHSAHNSVLILQANGVNAVFVDLTGWKESDSKPFDKAVKEAFKGIDLQSQLPIVTGYVKCDEGIMSSFDRGYSEITFSKVAVLTGASEGIIHKEFHLSTGDPKLIGVDKVRTIGFTNFDIADQLADMGMEAIHSKASKKMELKGIPIRVKNTFEPDDPGTLILKGYLSDKPKVDMICGREDIVAIEVFDSDMVGQHGYDLELLQCLARHKISYIAKNTNANTITHYVSEKSKGVNNCIKEIRRVFPGALVRIEKVAIVSAIGNNMKIPGFLYKAAKSLSDVGINILALDQCMRQVNMQFVISRENFKDAQIAMHRELVEKTE